MHRLRYQVLAFTGIRTVVNTMYRMVYPFLPVFVRGLGVELSALTLALTGRAVIGAVGPFLASISDTRGRKAGMLLGLGLFTSGVSLVVFWPTYPMFVGALLLTTVGKSVFDPTVHAYLGDRVSYQRRGLAVGLVEFGWSLSFIVGVPLAGFLIARQGWMAPFPILALLGVISIGLLAWIIPGDAIQEAGAGSLMTNIAAVFRSVPALAGLTVGLLISAANEMVNLVFGVWMEGAFGLQIASLGTASLVIGLAELGGESLVSSLTDRLGKSRAVTIGLLVNGLAALSLPLLGRSLGGAFIGLFWFYISFEFSLVSMIPLMTEILPAARATLVSLTVAGLSLGRGLGAFLTALIFPHGILASASVTVLFNLLALVALRWARIDSVREG